MCAAFRVIRKNGFCFNKKPENYALTWFVHLEEWIRRVVANFIQIYMDFVDLAQISRVIFNKLRLFAQFAWTMIADYFFVSSDCVVENVASGTINLQHCLSHINENRQLSRKSHHKFERRRIDGEELLEWLLRLRFGPNCPFGGNVLGAGVHNVCPGANGDKPHN